MEKRKLTLTEALLKGIFTNHEQMANGEIRYRLTSADDGSSYIRTVAGSKGAWQDSHFHKRMMVFIIVQKGWVVFAELKSGNMTLSMVKEGETFISLPGTPCNVYMSAGAVAHSVKFDNTNTEKASGQLDWYPCPALDKLTKHMSEDDILLYHCNPTF